MKTYRSSIFSFDTLDLHNFQPFLVARMLVCIGALLLAAELTCGFVAAPAGRLWQYWTPEAGVSFEEFRHFCDKGESPHVWFIGDSTAHANLVPIVFSDQFGGKVSAWNLGTSGNFPLAFQRTTLPLLEDGSIRPKLLVISLITSGFLELGSNVKSESAILSSPYCQKQNGVFLLGDWSYLARLRFCLGALRLIKQGKDRSIIEGRGYSSTSGSGSGVAELPNSAQARLSSELSPPRLEVLRRMLTASKKHNLRLVFILPPSLENDIRRAPHQSVKAFLETQQEEFEFAIYDSWESSYLQREDFFDRNHLTTEGAKKFTHAIGELPFVIESLQSSDR